MGFTDTHLIPLVDEGLGNSAYLVDLGDGRAMAVDASRDLRALRATSESRGLRVAFAADTHLHADFVTGALQLAHADGAELLVSAAGGREYPHRGLADGDEVDLGGLTLRALTTPGHTDEHLSYLLLDGLTPLGVFTGGSLIVGSAARTDLVDQERTRELARAQYRSVHRLAELPDETAVWPTHGAGSFCSAPPGAERVSTIGAERSSNALLAAPDADAFAEQLIGGLGDFPPYFLRLSEINRVGPAVLGEVTTPPRLDAAQLRGALADGTVLVDVRPVPEFAAGHIPGSLSIALRPQFATWLGWLLDPATPWIAIAGPGQDIGDLLWQTRKIGHPEPSGFAGLDVGGGELTSLPLLKPAQVVGRSVVDVRQEPEYADGHVPGAINIQLGDLSTRPSGLGAGPSVVMCGHGERAVTAASLLLRAGHRDVGVFDGGPWDWVEATDESLEKGT